MSLDYIYGKTYIHPMNFEPHTFFSALSNEIRLRCLLLLQFQGELCVCELTHALGLSQPMISRHLALLRNEALVNVRRDGQWIYYCINPQIESWMKEILSLISVTQRDQMPYAGDLQKLQTMPGRSGPDRCG